MIHNVLGEYAYDYPHNGDIEFRITVFGREKDFTSMDEKFEKMGFYPNPTEDIINLEKQYPDNTVVTVSNLSGSLSKELKIINNQLDLTGFASGVYIIKVSNEDQDFYKIIKH